MAVYAAGMKIDVHAGDYCPFHIHRHMEIVLHTGDGVTRVRQGDGPLKSLEFSKGDVIVYPALWDQDNMARSEGVDNCVLLDSEDGEAEGFPEPMVLHGVSSPYVLFELGELSAPPLSLTAKRRKEYDLRAGALLAALENERLERQGPGASKAEQIIRQALRNVEANLASIRTARQIAASVGVSPDYLRHLCKGHSGSSLAKLVAKSRLTRATSMLLHTNLPLKAVAASCGYSSERHLCHVVREAFGMTPTEFRTVERRAGRLRQPRKGFNPDAEEVGGLDT